MKRALLSIVFVTMASLALTGCIERRITITSNVPAYIYLDGEEIGETPLVVDFVIYGEREYVARAEGYEVSSGILDLATPWYEYPPIDFFVEVLLPFTIYDEKSLDVVLQPLKERSLTDLKTRADAYKKEAQRELDPRTPAR